MVVLWVINYDVGLLFDLVKVLLAAINCATISLFEEYAKDKLSST